MKAALEGFDEHFCEMIVFRFAVAVFVKDAIVCRDAPVAVRPQQSYQIDTINDRFLFARPMPVTQRVKL